MTNTMTPLDYKIERIKRRIKIKEVAEYMECSATTISRWENDHIPMTSDKIAVYTYFVNNYKDNK